LFKQYLVRGREIKLIEIIELLRELDVSHKKFRRREWSLFDLCFQVEGVFEVTGRRGLDRNEEAYRSLCRISPNAFDSTSQLSSFRFKKTAIPRRAAIAVFIAWSLKEHQATETKLTQRKAPQQEERHK
jgi:hypothetical protein